MAPFHNYPTGRATRQSLGRCAGAAVHQRALALLLLAPRQRSGRSGRGQPQGHRTHAHLWSDGLGQDRLHRLSGDACSCGRARRRSIFDKDRGLEILVRALGGEYLDAAGTVRRRASIRCSCRRSPEHVEFLKTWLRLLVRRRAAARSVRARSADLDQALRGTLALERLGAAPVAAASNFSIRPTLRACTRASARWCAAAQGDYAWVFDNPTDSVVGRLAGRAVIGFDVTRVPRA